MSLKTVSEEAFDFFNRPISIWLFCLAMMVWFFIDVGNRAVVSGDVVHRTDLTVYTEAGAAFFDGREPYEVTNPRGWHYLYPPMFAITMAPLSLLDSYWQAFVWFAVSVAMCCGCFFECRRLIRMLIPNESELAWIRPWLGMCVWLAAALPTLNTLQRGQVGIAVLYPLLLGFRLILQNRSRKQRFTAGLILSIPVVLKLTPIMPVGMILLQQFASARSENRRISFRDAFQATGGVVAGLILFVVLLPSVLVGPSSNLTHLQTWATRVVTPADTGAVNDFDASSPRNQSLANAGQLLIGRVIHDEDSVKWLTRMIIVGMLIGLIVYGLGITVTGRSGQAAVFGMACGLSLMVSPLSWGHHYTLAIPAVLFAPVWIARLGRLQFAVILAAIPAALCAIHWVNAETIGRFGVLGLGFATWCTVALWMFVVHRPWRSQPQLLGGPQHFQRPERRRSRRAA